MARCTAARSASSTVTLADISWNDLDAEVTAPPDTIYTAERRRPLGTVVAIGLATLAVVGVGAWITESPQREQTTAVAPTTTSTAPGTTSTTDASDSTFGTTIPAAVPPLQEVVPSVQNDDLAGLRLAYSARRGLAIADFETGEGTIVPAGIPGAPASWAIIEGLVVFLDGPRAAIVDPAEPGERTYLGGALLVLASLEKGKVWIVVIGATAREVVETDVDPLVGVLCERFEVGRSDPIADTESGLLLRSADGYFVVSSDAEPRRVATAGSGDSPWAVSAGPTKLATFGCNDALECGVKVTDLASGADAIVVPGPESGSVAFSPDESILAVFHAGSLFFIDVETGGVEVFPGTLDPQTTTLRWTPDGTRIFAALPPQNMQIVTPSDPDVATFDLEGAWDTSDFVVFNQEQ